MKDKITDIKYFSVKANGFVRPRSEVLEVTGNLNHCNSDLDSWGERDDLPTGDPVGDVETPSDQPNERVIPKYPIKFIRDRALYHKSLRENGIDNANKCFGNSKSAVCCNNPKNHKKAFLFSSSYLICKICNKDI